MSRTLIIIGVIAIVLGLAWPWISKLPLGRLPGDIVIDRPGFKLFFPFVTMILVSALVSFVLWLWRK